MNSIDRKCVERVQRPSEAVFEKVFLSRGRPVIITGAMDDWSATRSWSLDYLRSACGSRIVRVRYFPNGNTDGASYTMREMTLAEYLDVMSSDDGERGKHYLSLQPLESILPDLMDELPPCYLRRGKHYPLMVFIGRETYSQLHYHPGTEAISAQVLGSKRFIFYPPSQTPYLYPVPWYSIHFNFSQINLLRPEEIDRDRFPQFDRAVAVECELNPGEMVFIPAYWWHAVFGQGISILVTTFWNTSAKPWRFPGQGLRSSILKPLAVGAARGARLYRSARSALPSRRSHR